MYRFIFPFKNWWFYQDYYREPEILKHLDPFEVLVLCSELQIIPRKGHTEVSYQDLLRRLLEAKVSGINKP